LGCAKSILVGACRIPALSRGSSTKLIAGGDYVGRAVRTRDNVKPVYVSVGHRLSLDEAVNITLATGNGYRLPAPTRLADKLVARARQFPSTA
jgi:deoxyribonuclease V